LRRRRLTTEVMIFGAMVVMVVVVVGVVALDIYRHPPDPKPVGTAIIKVSGDARFTGIVGTVRDQHGIKGTTPVALRVPYRKADYVMAEINSPETVEAKIYVEYQVTDNGKPETRQRLVEEGRGMGFALMWKAPVRGN
jgi:hypothetical protein